MKIISNSVAWVKLLSFFLFLFRLITKVHVEIEFHVQLITALEIN